MPIEPAAAPVVTRSGRTVKAQGANYTSACIVQTALVRSPRREHLSAPAKHPLRPDAFCMVGIDQSLQGPRNVRPAQLPLFVRHHVIHTGTIRMHHAIKVLPNQLTQRDLSAAGMNAKARRLLTDGDPQIAALRPFTPAGFINPQVGAACTRSRMAASTHSRASLTRARAHDSAHAECDTTHLLKKRHRFAGTVAITTV
jgi:hypothetical protein